MKRFKLWTAILPLVLIGCGGGEFSTSEQKTGTSQPALTSRKTADLITGVSPLMIQKNYGLPQIAGAMPADLDPDLQFSSMPAFASPEYNSKKINSTLKSTSSNTVYRFLNLVTGVHFYTISLLERLNVERSLPQFQFEGSAFFAETSYSSTLSPVYRFYNRRTGAHFYTINESEKSLTQDTLSADYSFEGVAWYARTTWTEGWSPMRRFFNTLTGNHFYTASDSEFVQIQTNSPELKYEGVAYFVLDSESSTDPVVIPTDPVVVPSAISGLDPSFGSSGRLIVSHSGPDFTASVIVLSDDKFLIGGNCSADGLNRDFCVTRHLPDGEIDLNFGNNGRSNTPMTNFNQNEMTVMAVQNDGKIVAAGSCTALNQVDRDFCAARFLSNGELDYQFGAGGKTIVSSGSLSQTRVYALALQADGKILLSGDCSGNFCSIRLMPNGAIDPNFATNGYFKLLDGNSIDAIQSIALTVDGRILLSGHCRNQFSVWEFCTIRLDSDGTLDSTFGNSGKTRTSMAPYTGNTVSDMVLQSDGKFIVVGSCLNGTISSYDFCAAKFNPNGTLDLTYGDNGRVFVPVTPFGDSARAAKELADGKLVIGGTCQDASYKNTFCSIRLTSQGFLDLEYGENGKLILDVSQGSDSASSFAIQSTGQLLQAGGCEITPYEFETCAVRIAQ